METSLTVGAGLLIMGLLVILQLSLSVAILAVAVPTPAVTQSVPSPVPPCHDWGESREGAVKVLEGEAAWLDCPLFSHPTIYNYTSSVAAGLNLVWYHMAAGQDLEQPLDFHQPDHRLSKERDRLWLQPVLSQDAGQYFCMLRNKTSCAKIAVRLEVKPRSQNPECEVTSAVSPQQAVIPIQEEKTLSCPDVPSTKHSVLWFHGCMMYPFGDRDREVHGNNLVVHIMYEMYQGPYYCVVSYENKGKIMNFTRMINVTAVYPSGLPKEPIVINPDKKQVFRVKLGSDVDLQCKVMFPYLEGGSGEMWWTIDGKTVDHLAPRITSTSRMLSYDFGNEIIADVLRIREFNSEDLTREYNCSARNPRGFSTGRAVLEEEVYLPYVELGCGLGVTLFVMLGLFVVYHVFWLELLLLYRSWFGTDERFTDDKEYDIYISYARNSEEEHFVLMTLRRVLENELGYSVCIFDRDSIPGGNMMEAVLRCLQVSRRLLLVLSPDYLTEKSVSLLECRLGLYLQNTCQAHIITILYKPVPAYCTKALDMRRTTTITWRGRQSEPPNSRFWKRLRLALPVRSLSLGRRLIDSSSSHLDLASVALQCQRGTAPPHRQSSALARGRRKRSGCAGGDKCRRSIMRHYLTTQNSVVSSKAAGFTLALPSTHNTPTTSYTANDIGTTINPQTADSADTTDATHIDSYLLFNHTDKTDCFSKSIDSGNSLEKVKRTSSISQDQPCPLSTTTL